MPTRSSSKSSRAGSKSPRSKSSEKRATRASAAAAATTIARASVRADQIAAESKAAAVVAAGSAGTYAFTPEKDQWNGVHEFGGPIGTGIIMVMSHVAIYYSYICITSFGGNLVYPTHPALEGAGFVETMVHKLRTTAAPSATGFATHIGFLVLEWFLAVIMPGPIALGRAVPSENGFRHAYKCNAVWAWWTLLAMVLTLDYFDVWKLSTLARNYGDYLTSGIIVGNAAAVAVYLYGFYAQRTVRMTGNVVYDFFMGSNLNPKLPLGVDFKMLAELRVSWAYLFLITLSHAFLMYEEHGRLTNGMILLLVAHFLYANACQKGEECVMTTWDIFFEKFGWMLIFWNLAGVPVFYGIQALFIYKVRPTTDMPTPLFALFLVLLLGAYIVFDLSNGQKNRFRMMRDGAPRELLLRKTFPFLPWGLVENPRSLSDKSGREIFVDGLLRYARKINYTSDSMQAFLWGASCGFGHFLPFLYWVFHGGMLVHRTFRDEEAMSHKYGKLWDEYVKVVPYRFIPGIV